MLVSSGEQIYNSRNLITKFEFLALNTRLNIYNSRNLITKFELKKKLNKNLSTTVEI